MEILLVNSCVRKKSRTIKLARQLAKKLGGNVTEVFLEKERIKPLYGLPLVDRSILLEAGELWDDTFNYARQFADADVIIFAAPYWDLSFPAILKIYIETINIVNIAFEYGTIVNDSFGYGYVKELAEFFWGIKETHLIKVEGLDAEGADVPAIMENAIAHIKAEDF